MSKEKKTKPKKEGAKTRVQKAWKAKQLSRLEKTHKSLTKMVADIGAAKPPGIDVAGVQASLAVLTALKTPLEALAADWKPARGSKPGSATKIGIGSVVCVKSDLDRTEIKLFKHVPAELFANAVVLDDDGKYWMVKCTDNVTRLLIKKYTALAAPLEVKAPNGVAAVA